MGRKSTTSSAVVNVRVYGVNLVQIIREKNTAVPQWNPVRQSISKSMLSTGERLFIFLLTDVIINESSQFSLLTMNLQHQV